MTASVMEGECRQAQELYADPLIPKRGLSVVSASFAFPGTSHSQENSTQLGGPRARRAQGVSQPACLVPKPALGHYTPVWALHAVTSM